MEKLNLKKQKGITLIALIISIVILIILATVGINVLFNENGIIEKAQHAKRVYESSRTKEEEEIARLEKEYENIMNALVGEETPNTTDTIKPTVKVTASTISGNQITTTVTATDEQSGIPTDPNYKYYIKRNIEGGTYPTTPIVTQSNSYTFSGLKPDTKYDIKVEVSDVAGNIGSNEVTVMLEGMEEPGDIVIYGSCKGIYEIVELEDSEVYNRMKESNPEMSRIFTNAFSHFIDGTLETRQLVKTEFKEAILKGETYPGLESIIGSLDAKTILTDFIVVSATDYAEKDENGFYIVEVEIPHLTKSSDPLEIIYYDVDREIWTTSEIQTVDFDKKTVSFRFIPEQIIFTLIGINQPEHN